LAQNFGHGQVIVSLQRSKRHFSLLTHLHTHLSYPRDMAEPKLTVSGPIHRVQLCEANKMVELSIALDVYDSLLPQLTNHPKHGAQLIEELRCALGQLRKINRHPSDDLEVWGDTKLVLKLCKAETYSLRFDSTSERQDDESDWWPTLEDVYEFVLTVHQIIAVAADLDMLRFS
jgi:hypothetical protein